MVRHYAKRIDTVNIVDNYSRTVMPFPVGVVIVWLLHL